MRPGMTGLAQVTDIADRLPRRARSKRGVEADMAYIANWSLWPTSEYFQDGLAVVVGNNAD
jgi:lipopolysaccharide/colanic/teichoic acid biosynthesis glycosyltransferase